MSTKYFATCARGLEPTTKGELEAIGATSVTEAPGGVYFEGDQTTLYKAHLWLRTANRILLPLRQFNCRSPDELYENLLLFKWETFFRKELTFAVDCTISGRNAINLNHSHYARLRAKDAIVDRMREKTGDRPNVEKVNPDLSFDIYIRNGQATLNLDATGNSLHERGFRSEGAKAPLKESLAAGLLLLAGYTGKTPLVDAFCGSGTLLLEGALLASNTAPGLFRKKFLFENWPDFYAPRWNECREEAEAKREKLDDVLFFGYDKDPQATQQTKQSFERAGFSKNLYMERRNFHDFELPEGLSKTGLFISNPPYGERLGDVESISPLYKEIGDTMKKKMKGWKAAVFTGNMELGKKIGLRATRRIPLFNGAIDSRLFTFDLY